MAVTASTSPKGPSCVLASPDLTVHTPRLRLVAATPPLALAALEDRRKFGILVGASPDPDWPTSIIDSALTYFADTLTDQPELSGWLVWYVILKQAPGKECVIGSSGFAGPPDGNHAVRLGFAIVHRHRGRGYASEAAAALAGWAFAHGVRRVWSRVPANDPAALGVLKKVGMAQSGVVLEDGTVVYEKHRD